MESWICCEIGMLLEEVLLFLGVEDAVGEDIDDKVWVPPSWRKFSFSSFYKLRGPNSLHLLNIFCTGRTYLFPFGLEFKID